MIEKRQKVYNEPVMEVVLFTQDDVLRESWDEIQQQINKDGWDPTEG